MTKTTTFFTLGQDHIHHFNGEILDKNVVLRITAENPCEMMHKLFGVKWAFSYSECPDLRFYPRGVYAFDFTEAENPLCVLTINDDGITKEQFDHLVQTIPPEAVQAVILQHGIHPDFAEEFVKRFEEHTQRAKLNEN
jgi:hypothetical protein